MLRVKHSRNAWEDLGELLDWPWPAVEDDEAGIFYEPSVQLMGEKRTIGRIVVDQEHRYAVLTNLLDHAGALQCDDGVLPGRMLMRGNPGFLAVGEPQYKPSDFFHLYSGALQLSVWDFLFRNLAISPGNLAY
jgi:hypothetical protein